MKLLYFASDYSIGLSCLQVQQTIAIKKEGIPIICVAGDTEQEKGLTEQMQDAGMNLIRIKDMDIHQDFKNLSEQIGRIIEENEIQIVHVQNNWQLMLVAYYKFKTLKPKSFKVMYTLHGFRHNHPIRSLIAIAMIGLALSLFANRVFIMSNYVKNKFFFLGKKMRKMYLGIDTSFFEKETNEVDIERLRLIFPAQFRTGKNQDMIIDAVAAYIQQTGDTSIELYLPGEGPLLDNYKKQVKEKGLEANVIFPGQCSKLKIKELYEFCNLGVVSSNTETFGQSIVEPYVLGRCVLSRNVGVASDIIKDGESGYIFDDSESLLRILLQLSNEKEKIKEIGNHNFENRTIFSWEKIIKQYKEILLETLSV